MSWKTLAAACLAMVVAVAVVVASLTTASGRAQDSLLQGAGSAYGNSNPYLPSYYLPSGTSWQNAQPEPLHRSGYVHPPGWIDSMVNAHAEADKQRHERFSIGGLSKRVMHPLESVNEPVDDESERVEEGMKPMERAVASMQDEITGQQHEIEHLESMISALKDGQQHGTSDHGGEFSFSVPGKIEIGHLSLPAGAYTVELGGGEQAHTADSHHEASAHRSVRALPSSGGTVLDSRRDMDNGVDEEAVSKAAAALQKKLVGELEAARHEAHERAQSEVKPRRHGQVAQTGVAPRDDSVVDSAADMDRGVDRAAERRAAQGFLEQMIGEHTAANSRADRQEQAEERGGEVAEARRLLDRDEHAATKAARHLRALQRQKQLGLAKAAASVLGQDRRHVAQDKALLKELGAKP